MYGLGEPGRKELDCLANLQEWQAGLEFSQKYGGMRWRKMKKSVKKSPKGPNQEVAMAAKKCGGGTGRPQMECRGYSSTLTPWRCIENQLSDFCLPGWPCHDCGRAVGLALPLETKPSARPFKKLRLPAWWPQATPAVKRSYLQEKEKANE